MKIKRNFLAVGYWENSQLGFIPRAVFMVFFLIVITAFSSHSFIGQETWKSLW